MRSTRRFVLGGQLLSRHRSLSLLTTSTQRVGRVAIVAAARPNFVKVSPIIGALRDDFNVELVHTGQHYDNRMSDDFFADLRLPSPDVNLGVGSGTHAEQTAGVLVAFERYLTDRPADAVIVTGDVNSTVACALAAIKLHVPVAHVEAGLRSRDWNMPEEINRVLTDRISRWLFTTCAGASDNLFAEGIPAAWVHLVGNVMIDTLLAHLDRAREHGAVARAELGLPHGYGVLTLHRPSNVDAARSFRLAVEAITEATGDLAIVFPAHPRTAARISDFGITLPEQVRVIQPLGYLDFIGLMDGAQLALTDSGGVQEETSILGVPCVTLRDNTERPITCELGTNRLAGTDPAAVTTAVKEALATGRRSCNIPLWDGKSAQRIAAVLRADLKG
jgi:UDP-N-acetylglucosamine 2-epimerase (non-hydrolysing)